MLFLKRKIKKILWSEYVKLSREDKKIIKNRQKLVYDSLEYRKSEEKELLNLISLNNIAKALKNAYKPKFKSFNFKLRKIPLIGKIYGYYYQIYGRTFKRQGPITIIGKADKNDNYIYPNTRWNRITKLNKWIR